MKAGNFSQRQIGVIRRRLLSWYDRSGRDLPWRRTRNPYAIAVAEVMLQQTQVERVIPKYRAWLRRFPNISALARASLLDILAAWSGLGYNNRAVRLRAMARIIRDQYSGIFPSDQALLRNLPGFGEYTSGAVVTFAFNQRVGIVDTNVRRVFQRLIQQTARRVPSEQEIKRLADAFVDPRRPAAWNHAMMDLGSLITVVGRARCATCPWPAVCCEYRGFRQRRRPLSVKSSQRFEDSNRFVRGLIVRSFTQDNQLTLTQLLKRFDQTGVSSIRVKQALRGLKKDRILEVSRTTIRLVD